jgi:hypothetical protein
VYKDGISKLEKSYDNKMEHMIEKVTSKQQTLQEATVRYARVQHLKDYYPELQEIKTPLYHMDPTKDYYTPVFTSLNTFVLQEKFYKQMPDLEYSLKFLRSTAREFIFCDPK